MLQNGIKFKLVHTTYHQPTITFGQEVTRLDQDSQKLFKYQVLSIK